MFGFLNSQSLIEWGGFALIAALVYIETGFLIGLVVPGGGTLLFTAGLLAGAGTLKMSIWLMIPILMATAFLGDLTGYYIGKSIGDKLYEKEDTWYFKKEYLKKAEKFYHDKGAWALILGRFLPVVRTMNPLISGIGKIPFKKFIIYISIGVVAYISCLLLLGYLVGETMPWLEKYLKFILPGIVLIAVIPVVVKYYREEK